MRSKLHFQRWKGGLAALLPSTMLMMCRWASAQTTVFTDDFSANTSATYTTSGTIGSSAWSVTAGGTAGQDFGARRNTSPAQLELTNDATAATNQDGWVLVSTPTSSFGSPYNTTLSSNPGVVTWTVNMRQIRADPASFAAGNYAVAFILAATSNTNATTGSGYALVLGQAGTTDALRLAKYSSGLQGTLTNIIASNTTGLTDFGAEYLSIKVTYTPATNTWELFVRNDGNSAFADPATGSLTSQGTAVDSTNTGTSLPLMGAYWQGSTAATQTAFFDNITVTVCTTPATPTASNGGPYCSGATIQLTTPTVSGATYSWTGPNGFTSSLQNPTRSNATTADAGTYSVTVTVSGCTSAAGTTNVVVNATPATPNASNGGPYCEGATISLSTSTVSGATYSWTGPNGFTSSLQNPTRANAMTADAGTYSVTVTVDGCTSAAGTTNVVVNATPATPTASNGGPYCEGATISLSTSTVSGATYSWTGPTGFTSSDQNPTRSNAKTADAGTYSVTVTVNGCTSAAGTTNVVVNATPATPTASNGG